MVRFSWASLAAAAVLAGCSGGGETRDLPWTVQFETDGDRAQATKLEVAVLRGGCAGAEVHRELRDLSPSGAAFGRPPPLEPGTWAFAARARDASCIWFAGGCETRSLPVPDGQVVTVHVSSVEFDPLPACEPSSCIEGRCTGETADPDAGTAVDAGPPCSPGFGDCNADARDGCETALVTAAHCGTCGSPCAPAHGTGECGSGTCVVTCDPTSRDCDGLAINGCEVQLDSDPDNCGACDRACTYADATAICESGTCRMGTCDRGHGDCDASDTNGCEADFDDEPSCGGCGIVCGPAAHADNLCSLGECDLRCDSGWEDCDGSLGNGCETSVRTNDRNNCGGCGVTCSAAQCCESGSCGLVC